MAAPFILAGKMILQDLCRQKLGWDEDIPEDLLIRWRQWLQELPALDNISMDRCFKPAGFGEIKTATLHHFADASDHGYGSVSYLRLVKQDDQVHCSFVCGKSRVAPLKQMTIPRMELTSAVVAAKVDKQLRSELTLPLEDSHFWSNSTSVLGYVKNKKARFNIFVANRVAVIHELSEDRQWHYVPSQLNPADDASRGLDGKALLQCQRWKSGPSFLRGPDSEWPLQPNSHQGNDKDPVLKKVVCSSTRKAGNEILNRILSHFPNWLRLQRFVAWMRWTVKSLQRSLSKMVGSDSQTTSWVLFTSFLHSCEDAPWGSREWVDVSKLFSIVTFFWIISPLQIPLSSTSGWTTFHQFWWNGAGVEVRHQGVLFACLVSRIGRDQWHCAHLGRRCTSGLLVVRQDH